MVRVLILTMAIGKASFAGAPICESQFVKWRNLVQNDASEDEIESARAELSVCDQIERPKFVKAASEDDKVMVGLLSLKLCAIEKERKSVLAKIKNEKKYAGQTGVVRLRSINELRYELEDADERIAKTKAAILEWTKRPPRSVCREKGVEALVTCLGPSADDEIECKHPAIRGMRELVKDE